MHTLGDVVEGRYMQTLGDVVEGRYMQTLGDVVEGGGGIHADVRRC